MSKYVIMHGTFYEVNDELYHYGVKGMKWGVRKDEYKSMNRQQRRATKKKYYETDEGKIHKITRNTIVGTFLGGPVVGVAAGLVTAKRNPVSQEYRDAQKRKVNSGKKYVEDLLSTRKVELTISQTNSRVTGQEEAEFWKAYAEQLERERG